MDLKRNQEAFAQGFAEGLTGGTDTWPEGFRPIGHSTGPALPVSEDPTALDDVVTEGELL